MRKPRGEGRAARRAGLAGVAAAAAAGLALAVPAGAGAHRASAASGKLKVAFLYAYPVTDLGWDTAMYQGQEAVAKKYGSKVSITMKIVPDGPQDKTVEQSLISQGYKMIFATSFAEQTYTLPLAKANPGVKFIQVESAATTNNVATYFTEDQDAFYLAGMAAAAVSKKDTIGMVGGFPISDNLAETNGFALGAQAIKPGMKTRVTWTDNWDSVADAQNAASGLINAGAGAIAFLTTGAAPGQTATRAGVPWIGYQAEQKSAGASQYLTGVLWDMRPFFTQQVGSELAGDWKSSTYYVTMRNNTVKLDETGTLWSKVPASVKAKIAAKLKGFESGSQNPFTGPMYNQAGKLIVPAGKTLSSAQVAKMGYLVKGVIGTVPTA
jgi:basic membrane protein A